MADLAICGRAAYHGNMHNPTNAESLNRRNFAVRFAGSAVAASLAASAMPADAKAAEPVEEAKKTPVAEPPREEELYLALVSRLDAEHLGPEHLERIRSDIAGCLARSKRLSRFPLTNADEPAPVYSAWRAEG